MSRGFGFSVGMILQTFVSHVLMRHSLQKMQVFGLKIKSALHQTMSMYVSMATSMPENTKV